MFTRDYLLSLVVKYGGSELKDKDLELLLNYLRLESNDCPRFLTPTMLGDLLSGVKTPAEITDQLGRATTYMSMLGLYKNLTEMRDEYRRNAKEDPDRADEYNAMAKEYTAKAETAWAMIGVACVPLTQLQIAKDTYIWVVDVDRA